MSSPWRDLVSRSLRLVSREGPRLLREARSAQQTRRRPDPDATPRPTDRATATLRAPGAPPGRHLDYAPQLDGAADPGEVVWTWVPFEEDASQGKDRPVLVVGREGDRLLGLMLSSQDYHRRDPEWFGLGSGAWDGEHRPSWVRLDRVIDVPEDGIRREGAVLDRSRFDQVADRLRQQHGWR